MESNEVRALCKRVCKELGDDWSVSPNTEKYGAEIIGPDRVRLFASARGYGAQADRLTISGTYEPTELYGVERSEINVSGTRTPAAIAGEIRRRLVDTVREQAAKIAEYNARRVEQRAELDAHAESLAAILGELGRLDTPRDGKYSNRDISLNLPDGYGSVTVQWGGKVSIEVRSLPGDMAARVLAALAE